MKKKILAVVLTMSMACGMLACGINSQAEKQKAESTETIAGYEAEADASADEATAPSGEKHASMPEEQAGKAELQIEKTDAEEKTKPDDSKTQENTEKTESTDSKEEAAMTESVYKIEIAAKDIPQQDAFTFVENMKVGWNLGNTLDAHEEGKVGENELKTEEVWGNPVTTKAMIDEIKAAGFETVRIPVTWRGHVTIDEGGNGTVSEAWLNRVQEVVDYAIDNDMYVILNSHHDVDASNGYYPDSANYERSKAHLTAVWRAMAERFQDYDEHLVFESMNEPRLVGTGYEWSFQAGAPECTDAADCINRLNQTFVDIVRASGGNNAERYLMVPGYAASPDAVMASQFILPQDTASGKLIVSVHAYTPYHFALQAESESGSTDKFAANNYASTKDIENLMVKLYSKYINKGIPVIIGEFGAREKNGNLQARAEYYAYYIAAARARGITCCVWDNNIFSGSGERFGLYDRKANSWPYPEIVEAIMTNA